jgi:hypothetical protein
MTARGTWKAYETRVAKDLGGRRIPVTGIDRHGADVECPLFNVQIKLRRSLPAWLFDWLGGICSTTPEGKVGILILRKPRQEDNDALVVLRYRDWIQLHGTPKDEIR